VTTLDDRLAALDADLARLPGVLVAFSGGVDSGMLLAAAVRSLGADRVVAATAVSPSLPAGERAGAEAFAASLGVRHELPATHELDREGYVANAGDRCAFCKTELVDVLVPLAARLGIADTNADDLRAGFRPGIRAAAERGAWTPLARAGLTKDDVRTAAARWGLPLADKPAAACLASRIAYGLPVSAERLARVEAAEEALRTALADAGLAVRNLRVRDLGPVAGAETARVEVDAVRVSELAERPDLLAAVRGFDRVEVDPRGFRSGSMNELLPDPVRYR
jgi:uncharacterized protein (TIGR00268 family)